MTMTGRRSGGRLRLRLPARIITLHGSQSAVLRDLSQWGARISHDQRLRAGDEAVLQWGTMDVMGRVVWRDGNFSGFAFFDMLEQQELLETRRLNDDHGMRCEEELNRAAASAWASGTIRL